MAEADWGGNFDYGDYTWGTDPNDPGFYDPNLTTWDPASAYYQGPGSGYAQPAPVSPMDAPRGGGAYQVGSNDWNEIYAPSREATAQSAGTGFLQSGGGGGVFWNDRPSSGNNPSYAAHQAWANGPSIAPQNNMAPRAGGGGSGGGNPGARNVAQQSPQLISMGTPERTLYDRYKSMLMQPDQLQQDPAYQFMYNQGLQALNRSLAAKRMQFSGKAMNDTMAYGAGQAATGMKSIMPLYQAGAGEELNRFLGPAGLLPRYAASNNATIAGADRMVGNADDRAMYAGMLSQPYNGEVGSGLEVGAGIGYGGRSSGYTPTPQYAARPPAIIPRPMGASSVNYADYDLYNDPWGGP